MNQHPKVCLHLCCVILFCFTLHERPYDEPIVLSFILELLRFQQRVSRSDLHVVQRQKERERMRPVDHHTGLAQTG